MNILKLVYNEDYKLPVPLITPGTNNINKRSASVQPDIAIYPNPTFGNFIIDISGIQANLPAWFDLYSLMGQHLFSNQLTNAASYMQLSGQLAAGMYICKVRDANNKVTEHKLVVVK